MIMRLTYFPWVVLTLFLIGACNNAPRVIQPSTQEDEVTAEVPPTSTDNQLHVVVVKEVLPTTKYVYLKVKEGDKEFWIATGKKEVKKGETYYYRGGLLKTDFKSEEHDRIFEEVYLVSNLVSKAAHATVAKAQAGDNLVPAEDLKEKEDIPMHAEKVVEHKGAITIAELVKDPKKYKGHSVEITGTCVKVNPSIMGRNWLHIQDGSKDDYDLVVTSNTIVPKGTEVTLRAVVALNKDFGSGYTYELILENGTLVE